MVDEKKGFVYNEETGLLEVIGVNSRGSIRDNLLIQTLVRVGRNYGVVKTFFYDNFYSTSFEVDGVPVKFYSSDSIGMAKYTHAKFCEENDSFTFSTREGEREVSLGSTYYKDFDSSKILSKEKALDEIFSKRNLSNSIADLFGLRGYVLDSSLEFDIKEFDVFRQMHFDEVLNN